jgi:hypothetical protein
MATSTSTKKSNNFSNGGGWRVLTRKSSLLTRKSSVLTRKSSVLTRKSSVLTHKSSVLTHKSSEYAGCLLVGL